MSIINFTVNYDLFASQTDSSDSGIDADIVPLIGTVTFTPLTTDDRPVLAPTYSPRPAGFKLLPFTGYLDIDGRLKSERSGATGVRLWANDPVLKLNSLSYRVDFDLRTPLGEKVKVEHGYFTAPATDVSIQLTDVLQSTGTVSTSTLLPQGPKGDRGYGFAGFTPALDGTYIQALVESANGPVAIGSPFIPSNSYNSTVTHGTNASYARPSVSVAVIWIGSVQPTNAIDGDVWLDTSGTAPTITTTTLNSLNQNAPVSQVLVASGTTPLVWSVVSGMPSGLTLSSAGNLYGSPTSTGSYTLTVKCENAFGNNTKVYTGTVGGVVAPTISTTTLGTVLAGTAFSLTLVTSGSSATSWAVQSGTLPTGLSLNTSTGEISGTPSATGSYTFTIRATNSAGYNDKAFSGSVTGSAPIITTTSLGTLYRAFSSSITVAATGSATITFAVQSGSLPTGLSLNTSTGAITGTPSATGSYTFTVRATNSYGTYDQAFTGNVLESTPVIVETSLNTMKVSTAFSQTLTLSTGGPTITWSVSAGTLPTGLSLNTSTGAITGTPTTVGSYSFTIAASNGTASGSRAYTGSVTALAPQLLSVGTGSTAGTASLSWTDTVPSATKCAVLFVVFASPSTPSTPTVTIDGVSMTGSTPQISGSGPYGSVYTSCFYRINPNTGSSKAISVTLSGSANNASANIAYFDSVTSVGTVASTSGTGTTASQTISSTSTNYMYVHGFGYFSASAGGTFTGYNQTQLWSQSSRTGTNGTYPQLIGSATGTGSSLTFSGTIQSGNVGWGSVVLPLIP